MTQLHPPRDLAGAIALLARTDFYVGAGEEAAPTVDLAPGVRMRFLGFDVRLNHLAGVLILAPDAEFGPLRLRGSVSSLTLAGRWSLTDCDWTAEEGSWVSLGVGAEHTLTAASAGTEILLWAEGTIELTSADGRPDTLDVFRALDLCAPSGAGVPAELLL